MKNKSNSDVNNENLKDVNEGITEEEAKDKEKELEEQAKEEENDQEIKDEDAAEEDEELQTRYLRLAADFQNYKKRIEKEKSDIYSYANEKIITELLDVIDNFDRALEVESEDKGLLDGMKLVYKQFKGVLEKNGLEEIKAQDEVFDPNFHHAVMTEKVDSHESGYVVDVLQKGYLLNKKVIRPAMVKVAE
ncbi:MAG: nucleotide exchange factor GrpE [Clostridiales bacterium]|jgi:molecular chaperone GrpE|nr:nucleotide exchange factor GrpE [Clostridiales bacterium]